jgi:hypothetical protein
MRQWKIAFSLAIVAAIAAPLVLGTYKSQPYFAWLPVPYVSGFRPLTAEQREETTAYLARLNNCREFETIPIGDIPDEGMRCFEQIGLLRNGEYYSHFSEPRYLALNAAAAVAGFVSIFGLAMVLPALVRRYWRWLST